MKIVEGEITASAIPATLLPQPPVGRSVACLEKLKQVHISDAQRAGIYLRVLMNIRDEKERDYSIRQ